MVKESGLKERVDSSGMFNQDNYDGVIREVYLGIPAYQQLTLDRALSYAKANGYIPMGLRLLNIVTGDPSTNQPTEAIGLENTSDYCVYIVKNADLYDVYLNGQLKFID